MREYSQDVVDAYRGTFGRHLLGLTWFEQKFNGECALGDWEFFSLSGFLMSFGKDCALLTAGHVLADLDKRVGEGFAKIWGEGLFHGIGNKPTTESPLHFSYSGAPHWHDQNMGKGTDIAAIQLTNEIRQSCEANGMKCLSAEHIISYRIADFDGFVAIGIPLTTYTKMEQQLDGEIGHESRAQVIVMPLAPADKPPDVLPTVYSRMFFRTVQVIESVQANGMSGAPIFGLKRVNGRFHYRLVAMQFGYRNDGVIVASPSEVFVPIVQDWLSAGKIA